MQQWYGVNDIMQMAAETCFSWASRLESETLLLNLHLHNAFLLILVPPTNK